VAGTVRTARLVGEPIGPQHLDVLAAMHADERVMRTLGGLRTRAETRAMIAALAHHWREHGFGYWVFRDAERGEFVGRGGLRRVEIAEVGPEVEVGWAVAADRWRLGLGTEIALASVEVAFGELGLDSVVAFTLPDNVASRGVMDKAGFRYERDITWASLPHVLYRRTCDV
jgi:ribosomal-protein-alanine N-acetyltransferase